MWRTPGMNAAPRLFRRLTIVCGLLMPVASLAHEAPAGHFLQYGTGALIALQTILIIVLLIQNRRTQARARAEAQKKYAEVTHAARLALVGEITASIAHEVAQPMSAILSNVDAAQMLLRKPSPDLTPIREILADIRRDDLRADAIVRRLRMLMRKRELQLELVDINALISSALALVRLDAAHRHVKMQTDLTDGLPKVSADPVLLQQVLLNLLVNALEAMMDTPDADRVLTVRTQPQDQAFVCVEILDTGRGLPVRDTSRVFESFFTTKQEGMGLGLSIARSIIQMHGGMIWAENRAPAGAAFTFTVPRMQVIARIPLSA